eukprot:3886589-Amphidinium_carterae.1
MPLASSSLLMLWQRWHVELHSDLDALEQDRKTRKRQILLYSSRLQALRKIGVPIVASECRSYLWCFVLDHRCAHGAPIWMASRVCLLEEAKSPAPSLAAEAARSLVQLPWLQCGIG